ncbi:MAG TPA: T9SS type A sorting domain-containing protein [Bacteroidia bacterium]|nr:T9SS type A sorting domain-containing protein [Bacteroidia bacterium]
MKKITLLTILTFLSISFTNAQVIPNGGFENWTANTTGTYAYEMPDFWKTTDSVSLAFTAGLMHSAVKESSEIHGGSYALKLMAWTAVGSSVPGAASNGDIDVATQTIIKGTPDTVRHRVLNGFYRYIPAGSDDCFIIATLVKWNTLTNMRDTIAYGQFTTNTASGGTGYSPFTIEMSYNDWTQNPDTMVILITTEQLQIGSGTLGTVLYVDDLSFTGVVGIDSPESLINSVDVYPSPAASMINIRVDLRQAKTLQFNIYDIRGRHVYSDVLEPNDTRVNISQFPAGNYRLNIMDGNTKLYSAPFVISR